MTSNICGNYKLHIITCNTGTKGDQRRWFWHHRRRKPILIKMPGTNTKRQRTSKVWNYFIENVRYSRQVLEYSLRYSPSSKLLEYSDSTTLLSLQSLHLDRPPSCERTMLSMGTFTFMRYKMWVHFAFNYVHLSSQKRAENLIKTNVRQWDKLDQWKHQELHC